jgi:hypothetical protein
MDVQFVEAIGPTVTLIGVLVGAVVLLAGFVLDWRRAQQVGPGPLNGRPQIPS